jgi:hypothetical protein
MDTVLFYRLLDAIRDSLDRVGREPYTLDHLVSWSSWLDLWEFQDFLRETGHESVPLSWEGRDLTPFRDLKVNARTGDRELRTLCRTGEILLCRDALLASVSLMSSELCISDFIVVGERRPGALQELLDEYAAYSRRRSRAEPVITVIGEDRMPRPQGLGWESLILDSAFRDDLRTQVSAFFQLSGEYARMNVAHRRGMLFTGPPGNGKTSAIRVIASTRPEPFILYSMSSRTDKGELDQAFDRAAMSAPSILCFEDVDSLFGDATTLSHFLNRIDGLHPLQGVLILATTNHPEKLDAALTERPSRFDRVFHFGNPAEAERRRALSDGLGPAFHERLVAETDGFSMAQIKEVRVSACLEAIHAGLPGPTLAGALRSIDRLKGQKVSAERDWEPVREIGFRTAKMDGPFVPSVNA